MNNSVSNTKPSSSPLRFITATALFDGHDAAIHLFRRLLIQNGVEVIHLGHDRSVEEIVQAAVQENVQGIAVSSYQGGHLEFYTYLLERLKNAGMDEVKLFGGGGGVISSEEINQLHQAGVTQIFSPEDGLNMGLEGIVLKMIQICRSVPLELNSLKEITSKKFQFDPSSVSHQKRLAQSITQIAQNEPDLKLPEIPDPKNNSSIVVGLSGTGGSGKSTLLDELVNHFLKIETIPSIAVLCIDPSKRNSGGALLGDRLRFNSNYNHPEVFFHSLATRNNHQSIVENLGEEVQLLKLAGYDLIFLETAGIGQGDSAVVDYCDLSIYVMTPEYGAPTQLEKIDMIDFADLVAINKIEKQGGLDVIREVKKVYCRSRKIKNGLEVDLPVYGSSAHILGDSGVQKIFKTLIFKIKEKNPSLGWADLKDKNFESSNKFKVIQTQSHYLKSIVDTIGTYTSHTKAKSEIADRAENLWNSLKELEFTLPNKIGKISVTEKDSIELIPLINKFNDLLDQLQEKDLNSIEEFPILIKKYSDEQQKYIVRNREIVVDNFLESISGTYIPKVCIPENFSWGQRLEYFSMENVPGQFPFTTGVFPFKRTGEEEVTRMFAGEGTAERTNKRFHYVSEGLKATRLSTAFDSVTLYGRDPDYKPDIYGKIGNSGVSICTLDDMKRLYSGFNLNDPNTSVSMTINGSAPMMIAFFFNTAIDTECERFLRKEGQWEKVNSKIDNWFKSKKITRPVYRNKSLPKNHNQSGLLFLGVSAKSFLPKDTYEKIKREVFQKVRGTVQADILKEDQAQNTCFFSKEFALHLMGDIQEYFFKNNIRNYYSISISGYHIAEAGANPISQLAFTLANGFTYVEYFLSRGLKVDDFASNLSFFFSNGMDPEYTVLGRVARKIWAIAMRDVYGASEKSQKLKYHIQTSGRALHSKDIEFNDIRTTLQALLAINDNCNSLHTNAFDEALTTPTEESVRRAIAIQLIIDKEFGLVKNENPLQGSYYFNYLTREMQKDVLNLFEEMDARGGVLGAMESNFQRSRIQDESMVYEHKKHEGQIPIVGVNTFTENNPSSSQQESELIRSTPEEKKMQVEQVEYWKRLYCEEQEELLSKLKTSIQNGENAFECLMDIAPYCTLGQMTDAIFEVGGKYRRNT